ncbi:HIT domain-containing protein [Lipingzhangella sp. LS1_29]|uniref:HIT domain-containing protein n=1 Tax=Lipingzhangella rawalii TaxID=2055835 RepID=A0ABU2H790_9ACTN|nr:HIT domain-containing protein [Lipingzhangella rawalii]MDS1271184.1 HIT domain-containing protein [Lipingzhangella rawalii]
MAERDPECPFCGIVAGEIPGEVLREGPQTIAVRDINPQAPTHVLVLSRSHFPDAASAAAAGTGILDELVSEAHEVAKAEGVSDGYRLVLNTGLRGGQTVFHLHGHVLGGRGMEWPPG